MWTGAVIHSALEAADRWNVSYHAVSENVDAATVFSLVALGEFAVERRDSVDPQEGGEAPVCYLGLENVRSLTGEVVEYKPRPSNSVKSRSKVFRPGDILYGRLRPELNKVYHAEGEISEGICSGEFIVLSIDENLAEARYIRHVLASSYVTHVIQRYRAGAALPRISSRDLLSIKIPLPPLQFQKELACILRLADDRLRVLRTQLEEHPQSVQSTLANALKDGIIGRSYSDT